MFNRALLHALLINLILFLAYISSGWLSFKIATVSDFTAVVFFPAGIALAACLTYRFFETIPGIILGSFALNLFVTQDPGSGGTVSLVLPLLIAMASALQASVGSIAIKRFVCKPFTLNDDKQILRFIISVPLICLISATISITALHLLEAVSKPFLSNWLNWWVGDSIGVLIAVPLVMSFIGQPLKLWRSRRWLISVSMLVSLLIIITLTSTIKQIEDNRLADRFRIRTQEAATLLTVALRTQELLQASVTQLFASSSVVTREEFSQFVRWATSRNHYIQVVEWLPRIEHKQRASYEAEQQKYFGPDFSITEFVSKGQLGPASEHDVYFPITFIEPEWDNKPAQGFDPTSSPVSRQVINKAIGSGQAQARGPLNILRDKNRIGALLVYRAIYQRADGRMTLDSTAGPVAGLINIVVRVDDFIEEILQDEKARDFTLMWLDEESGEYYYQQPVSVETDISHEVPFVLAQRPMRLLFKPTQSYIDLHSSSLAEFVLISGFLLSSLFTMLFLSITGRNDRIRAEVSSRTEALSEATSRAQESERRIRDVLDEMQQAEQKLRLSDVAFNSASEAMMITDAEKRIIAVNSAFTYITGYNEQEVIGKNPSFLLSDLNDHDYQHLSESFSDTIAREGVWRNEIQCRHKNNRRFPAYVSMSGVFDADHRLSNLVAVFSDITEVKEAQAKIERHANYDILTDLPNRRLFTDRLQQAILRSSRDQEKLCLMFLDLDRFKDVNDTLGHEFGDELLRQMALRIRDCVREVDTVARLGGDEFTIILSDFESKSDAVQVAQKLIAEIEQPIKLKQQSLRITTSIGITFYPDDALDAGILIQNADRAMYAAKDMGGSAFKFYTSELESSWLSRTFIINELETAIEKGELEVFYQPLLSTKKAEACISAEALVRWRHPERGLLSPSEFLPQAERMGMIEQIDDFVFRQVCQQIKLWKQSDLGEIHISVNRSAHNFGNQRGRLDWLAHIEEQGVDASLLTLEITESVLMQRHAEGRHLLKKLRQAGVQIAVDDFGTGYSSLSYLKEMDVDYLKIDRSFVRDLQTDENDRAIIEAITDMAGHLGIQVVAEGVETASQCEILQHIGCHWLQGYFFAEPLTVNDFERFIEDDLDALDKKMADHR